MPEETINYKVNIDASDVSSQLDAIRSQIDGAIGAMSIGLGAGASPSFASPISTAPEVQLSPYNTINAITNRFNDQAMFSSQSGATGLGAFVEGTSEAFNLGYSKMSSGMRQMGMLSEMPPLVNYPSTGVDPFTLNMEMLSGAPMFSSSGTPGSSSALGGSLGFGWDKNGPLTYQEYTQGARQRLLSGGTDMITSSLGMLAGSGAGAAFGAAIGSSVPLLGTAVGFVAGVAFDGAMGLAMAEENQNRSVGKGLQQIASHSLMGGLGTNQAKSMAGRLLSMADTDFGLRTDTNRTDIQENLLGFANAGGFETVRTSEEFEKTAKGVIENTRKVITTLRKTQEEAVTLMADLQREGLVDVQDMGNFAANIAAVGKVTGLGSSDVLNFARQGAEMFRGSGINMSGGMGMLTRGIQDTRDMMKNHDVGAALVREMGGLEQATIGRIEGNVNFMNSTVGLLSYANFQSGGAVGDRMGMMNNAAGMNITDVYAMQAKRDRDIADGTLSTQRIAQERILTQGNFTNYIKLFNDTHETDFFDDKDNMQGYYKYMVRNEMAPSEAAAQDLFINAFDARMSPENQRRRVIDAEIATLSKSQDASPVTQQWNSFKNDLWQSIPTFGIPQGLRAINKGASDLMTSFSENHSEWLYGYNSFTSRKGVGTSGKEFINKVVEGDEAAIQEYENIKARIDATEVTSVFSKEGEKFIERNWIGDNSDRRINTGVIGKALSGGTGESLHSMLENISGFGDKYGDLNNIEDAKEAVSDLNRLFAGMSSEFGEEEYDKAKKDVGKENIKNVGKLKFNSKMDANTILNQVAKTISGGSVSEYSELDEGQREVAMRTVRSNEDQSLYLKKALENKGVKGGLVGKDLLYSIYESQGTAYIEGIEEKKEALIDKLSSDDSYLKGMESSNYNTLMTGANVIVGGIATGVATGWTGVGLAAGVGMISYGLGTMVGGSKNKFDKMGTLLKDTDFGKDYKADKESFVRAIANDKSGEIKQLIRDSGDVELLDAYNTLSQEFAETNEEEDKARAVMNLGMMSAKGLKELSSDELMKKLKETKAQSGVGHLNRNDVSSILKLRMDREGLTAGSSKFKELERELQLATGQKSKLTLSKMVESGELDKDTQYSNVITQGESVIVEKLDVLISKTPGK